MPTSEMAQTIQRRHAKVLYMELPLREGKTPTKLVAPGLSLDPARPVRMWLAKHQTAAVSWVANPGNSDSQSVPHCEFNIQVPVTYNGQRFYQSVYALTDDDVAMLHYRDTQGTFAKLGDLGFPNGEPKQFAVGRRGENLMSLVGVCGNLIEAGSSGLKGLFDHTLSLLEPNQDNGVFLHVQKSVKVLSAREFHVEALSILESHCEPIRQLFPKGEHLVPVRAIWLQADIGSDSDPAPAIIGTLKKEFRHMKYFMDTYMLKYGGAQVDVGIPSQPENTFQWQNGRFLWLTVKIKPEVAQKQLPPGTTLADDKAHLFCAYYPTATLNSKIGNIPGIDASVGKHNFPYHELGIRLQAKMANGDVYHHVTYILVDDDVCLMTGRDLLGTPKKMMSNITFPDNAQDLESGSVFNVHIERRGALVLKLTGRMGSSRTGPVPGMTDGIKDMSVFTCQCPMYASSAESTPSYVEWFGSYNVHENRMVDDADITFGSSAFEPLDSWLVSGPPLAAGFFRQDYGALDDFQSRPVVGTMPLEQAQDYYHNTFQSHYGGGHSVPATRSKI